MSYTAYEGEKGYRDNKDLKGKTFGEILSDRERDVQRAVDQNNGEKPEWLLLEEKRIEGMKKALEKANVVGQDIRTAVIDTLPPGALGEANLDSRNIRFSSKLFISKENESIGMIEEQNDLLAITSAHEATHLELVDMDKKQASRSREVVEGVTQLLTNQQVSEGQKFGIYSSEVSSVEEKLTEQGHSAAELIQAIRSEEQKKVVSILDKIDGKQSKPTEELAEAA